MKNKEFARALAAYADIAELQLSGDLLRFSHFFGNGASETMLARLKKLHPAQKHPTNLKRAITGLHATLVAMHAKKQAHVVELVLGLFAGDGGATVDGFLREISMAPNPLPIALGRRVDLELAKGLIEKLNRAKADERELDDLAMTLSSPRHVNVPTLAYIARDILGGATAYRDRQRAVKDIIRSLRNDVKREAAVLS